MKDNDRLFEMRFRVEKTVALIEQMDSLFSINKKENLILAIMASNYDAFWEGYSYHNDANGKRILPLMQEFCAKFYASDYLDERDREITEFLVSKGFSMPRVPDKPLNP